MTRRPGRIVGDLRVELPQPRDRMLRTHRAMPRSAQRCSNNLAAAMTAAPPGAAEIK